MSDTENQENMSVEDILSSIKNILVDEEENEKKTEEDVLNLDNSMIVDNPASSKNIETLLDSMTEPVNSEEKEISEATTSLADSIDVEKTLDIADKIDLNDISTFDGLIEKPSTESEAGVNQDAIDASANIINNFAKVFAEKQHSQQSSAAPSETQSGSTEISNAVKDTIIEQVKQNIEIHFEQIASKIITEHTQQWLNSNLPNIVEKIVAKEIERVIAKVGS